MGNVHILSPNKRFPLCFLIDIRWKTLKSSTDIIILFQTIRTYITFTKNDKPHTNRETWINDTLKQQPLLGVHRNRSQSALNRKKRDSCINIYCALWYRLCCFPKWNTDNSSYVTVRHKLCWSVQAGVFQPATCFFPALGDKFKYYDLDIRLGGTTYLENSSIIVMDGFVTFAVYSHCCRNIVTDQWSKI